jgi:hypothetical protein
MSAVHESARAEFERHQVRLVGAFRTAMRSDDEAIVIWAIPSFAVWAAVERGLDHDSSMRSWRTRQGELGARVQRTLLVDAPLSPLRIGRQPEASDRLPFDQI